MKRWARYKGLASLALLSVVAPALVWQYALGGTVSRWRATAESRRQITRLRASLPEKSGIQSLASAGGEMILSGLLVAELLPTIEAEGLRIEHFAPFVTSETDGVRLTTGGLTVRGGFRGMVRLLDRVEREVPRCKIVSAHYRASRPRNRNAIPVLSLTIYVQQITAIDLQKRPS